MEGFLNRKKGLFNKGSQVGLLHPGSRDVVSAVPWPEVKRAGVYMSSYMASPDMQIIKRG